VEDPELAKLKCPPSFQFPGLRFWSVKRFDFMWKECQASKKH